MSDFDDRELGDALRRRAGAATDGLGIEAARTAVVARAGRVRRRRAAVAGGAAMAGLIAAAVFVIGPGSDSTVTTPADQTDGAPATSVDSSVDMTTPGTGPDRTEPDRQVTTTTAPTSTLPGPTTTDPSAIPPTGTATSTTAPSTSEPPAPGTTVVATPTTPTTATTPTTTTVAPVARSGHPGVLVGRRLDLRALGRRCVERPGRDTGSRVQLRGGRRSTRSDEGSVPGRRRLPDRDPGRGRRSRPRRMTQPPSTSRRVLSRHTSIDVDRDSGGITWPGQIPTPPATGSPATRRSS